MPESSTPSDAELLRRHCKGDAAAFAQLYDRHDRASFDYIRRCLYPADTGTAEDVHQEVWLAVARNAAQFDEGRARFVTWLFTIARNRVFDVQRQRQPLPLDEEVAEALPAPAEDGPAQRLHDGQLAQALKEAVQALPWAQRETFVLFSMSELSLQEIASLTGVPVETAKTRLRYARNALRARLGEWRVEHV